MRIEVLHGKYPPAERDRRRRAVTACASPGTDISFTELDAAFYSYKVGPAHALLIASEVCRAAEAAEASGADAVVPFGTLDPGVEAARHFVDIPVVGAGQVGFHLAATLGQRVAVLVYEKESIPNARRLAEINGLGRSVVSYEAVGIHLGDATTSEAELKRRIVELAVRAVDEEGAEVLYPKGVTMVPVHFSAREISEEVGIPVVDALAASIAFAELLARTGVKNSRAAYPYARETA